MRHESTPPAQSRTQTILADRRGFALEATLIVLVLISLLVGASVAGYVMVQRSGSVDYRATRVTYAAEAGADAVISQLAQNMTDGIISSADIASITLPSLSGFTFATPTVNTVGSPVPRTITNGPFSGLVGLNQQIDIGITATDPANNRAQVVVTANAQSIPLFQFGVFYNEDLEIHNGPTMDFAGWVHTNANLYLTPGSSTGNTSFHDLITTPDSLFWQRKNTAYREPRVYIDDASGTAQALNFDSRSNPGQSFVTASNTLFNGRVMTGVSGVQPLKLPLPDGMPAIQLILPRNGGDDADTRAVKFAWKATAHITVDMAQLNNVSTCAGLTILGSPLPTGADCAAIFSGNDDAFWDGRENIGADVFNINMGALQTWANGNSVRDYSIVYVTFTNVNAGNVLRDYPVVRISNGSTLRWPVTVSTDRPMYIWGNYNSVGWQPASFIADAVTFLSPIWTDAAHAVGTHTPGTNWTSPPVPNVNTSMTVYAAIAAGHSATPCDWQRPSCVVTTPPPAVASTGNYGGGLENFPRFLENWSNDAMIYRGSLVSLFQSQYAARRRWSWITYYNPPDRDWRFDLRFRDPRNLPPGTPVVGSVVQTSFRPVF